MGSGFGWVGARERERSMVFLNSRWSCFQIFKFSARLFCCFSFFLSSSFLVLVESIPGKQVNRTVVCFLGGWRRRGGGVVVAVIKSSFFVQKVSFSPLKRGGNLLLSLVKPLCDLDQEEADLLFCFEKGMELKEGVREREAANGRVKKEFFFFFPAAKGAKRVEALFSVALLSSLCSLSQLTVSKKTSTGEAKIVPTFAKNVCRAGDVLL